MRTRHLSLILVLLTLSTVTLAQFELPKKLPRLPKSIPGLDRIPGLDKILGKGTPVTTSLADALTEVEFLDNFEPRWPMTLGQAARNADGAFTVRPGTYTYTAQSYCLKAGTYGPGRGEGYLYAPLKGPKSQIVRNILRRSTEQSEIPQRDIQVLLWAIIARTRLSEMSRENQLTASRLLTPKELFDLNGGALGLIPESAKQQALANLPDSVKNVIEAENKLRQMLTKVNSSFDDLERVAVLLGEPPVEPGDRTDLPRQRWSWHPDGYFIRFDPHGYSSTRVDVSVPEWFEIQRDAAGRITRIADRHGHRIEATYAAAAKSGATAQASPFSAVRFVNTLGASPNIVAKWEKSGWVLTGVPEQGAPVAGETLKMTDVSERLAGVRRHRAQAERTLSVIAPKSKNATKANAESVQLLADLASFAEAMRSLASSRKPADPRLARYIEIPIGGWQSVFARAAASSQTKMERGRVSGSASNQTSGGTSGAGMNSVGGNPDTDVDPSGNVGTPGQTARQRIGQSARCGEECGCDRPDFCKDLAAARASAADPGLAAVSLKKDLANLKKDFCDNPAMAAQIDMLSSAGSSPQALIEVRWALNEMMDQAGCVRPPECPITSSTPMSCPHGGRVVGVPMNPGAVTDGSVVLSATDTFHVVGCPYQPTPCLRVTWHTDMRSFPELSCRSTGIALGPEGDPRGPVTTIATPH